jgi:hypothetical protein
LIPLITPKRPPRGRRFTRRDGFRKIARGKHQSTDSGRTRRSRTTGRGDGWAARRGATVPFVARYRKEITGALDDAQLRTLEERLNYLRELEERRITILNSVREQGKLDAALEAAILAADSKLH